MITENCRFIGYLYLEGIVNFKFMYHRAMELLASVDGRIVVRWEKINNYSNLPFRTRT